MDPFDEIVSKPGVSSRAGSRFQPKIKPRPIKQTLPPHLCTQQSQDNKETTISDAKSCLDGIGNTNATQSSSQLLSVIHENKESEDDLLLATTTSDFITCSHPPSLESAKKVDSLQFVDSCASIHPSGSTIFDPAGQKYPTDDDIQNSVTLNYSASTSHDGKISGENIDVFYELECLDDFQKQPKNEADPASLKQSTLSSEDGDLEVEEGGTGADITMNTISSGATTSVGIHSDGILNDSTIDFDGYTPASQDTQAPATVEFDSYGNILVDDFNSDYQDEMEREPSGKEKPSMESNISQPQEMSSIVGEDIDHSKSSRKVRKKISHQLDEPEDGVEDDDESENFSDEPSKGGKSRGKKASTKSSKPSGGNEKPTRKRKEANKEVPDAQAEKRPKKFSHSTRRNKRQVNQVLLDTPEDDIDFQKISFRDLIIYHEYKEKLEKKAASTRKSATNQSTTNQRPDSVGEEIYNDGEESLASEQGRATDDDVDDEMPDVVDMTSAYFNYHSFMNKTPRAKWSKHDTGRFYEAVRQFGTDFCMIQQLFPGRSRHQIKLKYKNEERRNPSGLSDALTNRAIDHSHFLSLIGQLKEASKEKQQSNQDELTENTGDEELPELSPQSNEEVGKPEEEEVEEQQGREEKEESVEIQSPTKADETDEDDDPNRWDQYNFDF